MSFIQLQSDAVRLSTARPAFSVIFLSQSVCLALLSAIERGFYRSNGATARSTADRTDQVGNILTFLHVQVRSLSRQLMRSGVRD